LQKKLGTNVVFTKNAVNVIYKNSVFPYLGVRQTHTVIDNVLMPALYSLIFGVKKLPNKITVEIDEKASKIQIKELSMSRKIVLEITDKEQEYLKYKHNTTAVHEVGHAVVGMYLLDQSVGVDMLPLANGVKAMTRYIWDDRQYDRVEGLYRCATDQIAVSLAGKIAEEFVFGLKNGSEGCAMDLCRATSIASGLIREAGYEDMLSVSTPDTGYGGAVGLVTTNNTELDVRVEQILQRESCRTLSILEKCKDVFIDMVDYLTDNTYLSEEKCKEYLKRIRTIRKDQKDAPVTAFNSARLWRKFKRVYKAK
jgi:ATP-dependent Zn protease